MIILLLGVALFVYGIVTMTPISFVNILVLYVLPLQLYYDFNKKESFKTIFLRRGMYERKKIKKKVNIGGGEWQVDLQR